MSVGMGVFFIRAEGLMRLILGEGIWEGGDEFGGIVGQERYSSRIKWIGCALGSGFVCKGGPWGVVWGAGGNALIYESSQDKGVRRLLV